MEEVVILKRALQNKKIDICFLSYILLHSYFNVWFFIICLLRYKSSVYMFYFMTSSVLSRRYFYDLGPVPCTRSYKTVVAVVLISLNCWSVIVFSILMKCGYAQWSVRYLEWVHLFKALTRGAAAVLHTFSTTRIMVRTPEICRNFFRT